MIDIVLGIMIGAPIGAIVTCLALILVLPNERLYEKKSD